MKLLNIKQVQTALPLSVDLEAKIKENRQEIQNILLGKDNRKLVILGPCSFWPINAGLEHARLIAQLQQEMPEYKFVCRVYGDKPRTTIGWRGGLYQIDPLKEEIDINQGIMVYRNAMIEITKMGLPVASEIVELSIGKYLEDVLSYVAIGARTVESNIHRVYASNLDGIAVGFKNATSGDIQVAIDGVETAKHPGIKIENNRIKITNGNHLGHVILRGSNQGTNYDQESIMTTIALQKKSGILHPSIVVDLSHGNSLNEEKKKDPLKQMEVLKNILNSMKLNPEIYNAVKGVMIESFNYLGNQSTKGVINPENLNLEGLSITDGCIDNSNLVRMLREASDELKIMQKPPVIQYQHVA